MPWNTQACHYCALPLPRAGTCGQCLVKKPPVDKIIAPLIYEKEVKEWLIGLKYHRNLAAGRVVTSLFAPFRTPVDALVPVPIHPQRRLERGYNQAEELARHLQGDKPVLSHLVSRVKWTVSQVGQKAQARRQQLKGAFAWQGEQWRADFKTLALVDDVMTTGSTLYELAKVIQHQQPEVKIHIWAMARARKD